MGCGVPVRVPLSVSTGGPEYVRLSDGLRLRGDRVVLADVVGTTERLGVGLREAVSCWSFESVLR